MNWTSQTHSSWLSRWLLVISVLCVLGLQTQETLHDHGASGPEAQCLLCHSYAGQALVGSSLPLSLPVTVSLELTAQAAAAETVEFDRYFARGPPDNS
tara:strand:- start:26854 stop:27147 length:294 start_codon:yes stop_codon:yes gene_type:complete